jgi:hypothetical protein
MDSPQTGHTRRRAGRRPAQLHQPRGFRLPPPAQRLSAPARTPRRPRPGPRHRPTPRQPQHHRRPRPRQPHQPGVPPALSAAGAADQRRAVRALRDDRQAEHADALRQDRRPGLGARTDRPPKPRTGHGRRDKRTIRVLDAPEDLGFPAAAQVFLIERYTTRTVRKRPKGSRRYKKVLGALRAPAVRVGLPPMVGARLSNELSSSSRWCR